FFSVFWLLSNVEGKFVDSTVKLTEKVKLECIYPKKAVIMQTSWMKLNVTHKENIAVLHPIYGVHIEDKYNGRIYFENASREDKSLSFTKSTLEDVGLYFCSIVTYPDGIWEKVIEIIQTDAFEVSAKQTHPVFAKPGRNVALTCPHKTGDSVQQVMWERIKADQVDTIVLWPLLYSSKVFLQGELKNSLGFAVTIVTVFDYNGSLGPHR
uniref:CD226 molecule n=1 Tax=Strix occidentalis caurina TaxID=311401 RepID=A0A8D0FNX5_STROC